MKTDKATILKLKIGNMQKTNITEKRISTVSIGILRSISEIRREIGECSELGTGMQIIQSKKVAQNTVIDAEQLL